MGFIVDMPISPISLSNLQLTTHFQSLLEILSESKVIRPAGQVCISQHLLRCCGDDEKLAVGKVTALLNRLLATTDALALPVVAAFLEEEMNM